MLLLVYQRVKKIIENPSSIPWFPWNAHGCSLVFWNIMEHHPTGLHRSQVGYGTSTIFQTTNQNYTYQENKQGGYRYRLIPIDSIANFSTPTLLNQRKREKRHCGMSWQLTVEVAKTLEFRTSFFYLWQRGMKRTTWTIKQNWESYTYGHNP